MRLKYVPVFIYLERKRWTCIWLKTKTMLVQPGLKRLNGHAFAGHEEHYVNVLITVISRTFEKMPDAIHYALLGRSQRVPVAEPESKKRVHAHVPSRGPRHQDRKYRGGRDVVRPGTPGRAHTYTYAYTRDPDIYTEC